MVVVAAAHEIRVQRVDRAGYAVDRLNRPGRCDEGLSQHLASKHPPMRLFLAAPDEDDRGRLAQIGLLVTGRALDDDPCLAQAGEVKNVEQVSNRVGGRVGQSHEREAIPGD